MNFGNPYQYCHLIPFPFYSGKECGDDCEVEGIVRNMKAAERAVLGFMCKQIIDRGRLMWMTERGLQTQFVKYVPPTISPENHLLVAGCSNHL